MNTPLFTAEASLYKTSERYQLRAVWAAGSAGVTPQQVWQICVPPLSIPFRDFCCTPCLGGRQVCCPRPGVGLPCFVRECMVSL
jgi:hypothetical protein